MSNVTRPSYEIVQMFRKLRPDKVLLFVIGDTIEAYDQDAEILAKVRNVTPPQREAGQGLIAQVPLAQKENLLAMLLVSGHDASLIVPIANGSYAAQRSAIPQPSVN